MLDWNRERYYVHGTTYIDERAVLHDESVDKDFYYMLKDLYSVAGLVDEGGRLEESVDYDAYGKVVLKAHGTSDFDMDGDVDGVDFGVFSSCYNQAGNPPKWSCTVGLQADYDNDGDVDGVDSGVFASCYNGNGNPPRTLGCGPNAVETIDITESRHDNPYHFTGRWLNFIKEAATVGPDSAPISQGI